MPPRVAPLLLALALAAPGLAQARAPARAAAWRTSWAAPPAPSMGPVPGLPPEAATPTFGDQTIVQVVRLSAGGARVRLRFTNEYGGAPLSIGRARVAAPNAPEGREVTFAGSPSAVVPPHAPLVSDPVELPLEALSALKVSLYVRDAGGPTCTCHAVGLQTAQVSPPGDYTDRPFTPVSTTQARAFLSAVDVEGAPGRVGVVAFGDSITDGFKSTADANRRWPDRLAERLAQAGRATAVANEGLSGNRVLGDGAVPIFGESALSRFDRDVLGQPGVTHVIVLEGVNDLGAKPAPSPEALIAGYRQLIARAHAHGIRLILATILPYEGTAYFRPEGEAARQAVNAWILSNHEADGAVDFDAVMRDPADPARLRADLQSGDWLHPNDAGYRVMGDAVPLSLLR